MILEHLESAFVKLRVEPDEKIWQVAPLSVMALVGQTEIFEHMPDEFGLPDLDQPLSDEVIDRMQTAIDRSIADFQRDNPQ